MSYLQFKGKSLKNWFLRNCSTYLFTLSDIWNLDGYFKYFISMIDIKFFWGTLFFEKLSGKNLKIKTRILKSLMEEEIPSGISMICICISECVVYTPSNILNQSQVIIMFSSGAGVEVQENNGFLGMRIFLPLSFAVSMTSSNEVITRVVTCAYICFVRIRRSLLILDTMDILCLDYLFCAKV